MHISCVFDSANSIINVVDAQVNQQNRKKLNDKNFMCAFHLSNEFLIETGYFFLKVRKEETDKF